MVRIFIKIFFVIIIINFYSCNKDESDNYFKAFDYPYGKAHPSSILTIVLPVVDNENKFEIIAENMLGKEIFEKYYKSNYSSYPEFLHELQNNKIYLNAEYFNVYDLENKIDINDSVHQEYSKYGINFIISKYLKKKSSNEYFKTRYYTKPELPLSTQLGLKKIMYLNKYYVVEDCVGGGISFEQVRKKDGEK